MLSLFIPCHWSTTTTGQTEREYCIDIDIHSSKTMNPNNFVDPLAFPLAPPVNICR